MISGNRVNISGGTFNQNYNVNQDPDLFKLNPVSSAGIHALDEEGCMEGTRVSLLDDLRRWSTDTATHRIFWLDGMAGTGKSSIARSFCRFLDEKELLGGSFFCLRGNESRANVKRILPTLAWFLARQDWDYQKSLLDVLREAPDVQEYSIERQVGFLLQNPLRSQQTTRGPLVLVIDALDECANAEEVTRLLKKLLSVAVDLPIKFFLTSRPERHILTHFKSGLHHILRLHDIHQDLVEKDIFLYLNKRLTDIRSSNNVISSIFPASWPARKDVKILTRLSGKLFIYAFTAVQYIGDENPVDRLRTLTGLTADDGDNQPFHRPLDEMYSLVLSTALDPQKRRREEICLTKRVLGAVFALREPLYLSDLARLLEVAPDVIRANIDRIHALINVPPHNKDGVVSTFHASLVDFLTTERASEKMRIKLAAAHEELANRCLEIMNSDLHFNIANCKTSYLPNSEQTLAKIPTVLRYSCLHWAHHVVAVDDAVSLMLHVEKVLLEKFLFWLEVLSVIGMVGSSSSSMIGLVTADTTKRCMTENLSTFLQDANYFVVVFREIIESYIPHIYLSALPSSHRTSKIAEVFTAKYPSTMKVSAFGIQHRRKQLHELRGHLLRVNSVALSRDGTRIVSGSSDKTIRVWDAKTGEVIKLLKGHTDYVWSVAFSPDGTRIVSGSFDKTIRIWDLKTGGEVVEPLKGHTHYVNSVAFSPDGTRIVSGSLDKTIRIWDAKTGEQVVEPLKGHTEYILSVALSPDGTRIASGSSDKTIRIWDAKTGGAVVEPLKGHSSYVLSVAFSPDGTHIVSSSDDETIRIWDGMTGGAVVKPLKGHTGYIRSVAFSPDGTHIVSGSDDKTIRIWDARTGEEVVEPLGGHTSYVLSVAFSPDGTRIISGSDDHTIRIWDAKTGGEVVEPLKGHTSYILSVAFSPDGTRIVSGPLDTTIRIWDAQTGEEVVGPLKGHTHYVNSVAFSPDGTRIVSGSLDKTIRIWDAMTGVEVVEPLKGHTHSVQSVAFSPDGTRIVSGSLDKTIRIWDAKTGEEVVEPLKGHTSYVLSVAFSPDGTRIVSGSDDKTIQIWNAKTGDAVVEPLRGHTSHIRSVVFSPDGTRIVSGSGDKTIRIWDAKTGAVVEPLKGHTHSVQSVVFSPDGTHIVSGSDDQTIRIWDAKTGVEVVDPLKGHTSYVRSVAFSPDGTRIVSGSSDMTIRIWDAKTGGVVVEPLKGHTHFVQSVAFSPDGPHIVSDSDDTTILLSYAKTAQAFTVSNSIGFYHRCVLSPLNGWIEGPAEEPIFWVLPEWRPFVVWPPCLSLIAQSRIMVDPQYFVHGADWTRCAASP